jgi:hypothetical protein
MEMGLMPQSPHRRRDYYEHNRFDATNVPAWVALQQRRGGQEALFGKGF